MQRASDACASAGATSPYLYFWTTIGKQGAVHPSPRGQLEATSLPSSDSTGPRNPHGGIGPVPFLRPRSRHTAAFDLFQQRHP